MFKNKIIISFLILLFCNHCSFFKKNQENKLSSSTQNISLNPETKTAESHPNDPIYKTNKEEDKPEETISKNFRGTLSQTKAITAHLEFNSQNQVVNGNYYYDTIYEYLYLHPTKQKDKQLILEERDDLGIKTGEFSGTLEKIKINEKDLWKYKGIWTSPNKDRQYPFEFTEIEYRFANGAEIISKKLSDKKKNIEMEYPQIEKAKTTSQSAFNKLITQLVKKEFQATLQEFKEDLNSNDLNSKNNEENNDEDTNFYNSKSFVINYFSEELISISFIDSAYTGGAHPAHWSSTINYDFKQMKTLSLKELFKDPKFLKLISNYSIQKLEEKLGDELDKRNAAPSLKNYEKWNITSGGLLFTFDEYAVASYAAGPQEVFIPYSKLCPLINLEGPLASFCKK